VVFAEIRGKLAEDASRSEDVLTSTAFGLLTYLPFQDGLKGILLRARRVGLLSDDVGCVTPLSWTGLDDVRSFDVHFWPCFEECGAPDVLVELRDMAHSIIGAGVFEVKYFAGKSGRADDDDADDVEQLTAENDGYDPDQLVKYWNGLRRRHPALSVDRLFVVYLTTHFRPPLKDLRESQSRKPSARFGWLSWYDFSEVTEEMCALPARDLAQLLKFKGLGTFSGFRAASLALSTARCFWRPDDRSALWFDMASPRDLPRTGFWRSK